jgi:hypothetical protein
MGIFLGGNPITAIGGLTGTSASISRTYTFNNVGMGWARIGKIEKNITKFNNGLLAINTYNVINGVDLPMTSSIIRVFSDNNQNKVSYRINVESHVEKRNSTYSLDGVIGRLNYVRDARDTIKLPVGIVNPTITGKSGVWMDELFDPYGNNVPFSLNISSKAASYVYVQDVSFVFMLRNKNLREVTLPSSIESIGPAAFKDNVIMENVYVMATTPPNLAFNAFEGCVMLEKIYVPSQSVQLYRDATNWCFYASIIEAIPS